MEKNLPDRTELVGREDTLELILDTLTSNKAVEIVAPPGYGKTSLVVELKSPIRLSRWENVLLTSIPEA